MEPDPRTPRLGQRLDDFVLRDDEGAEVRLSSLVPVALLVYPGQHDAVALRDYRDAILTLKQVGVRVAGVSPDDRPTSSFLRRERGLGFPLLSDPTHAVLSQWGLSGRTATLFIDRDLVVRQLAIDEPLPARALLTFARRAGALGKRRFPGSVVVPRAMQRLFALARQLTRPQGSRSLVR